MVQRKMDELCRIVLPRDMINALGITPKSVLNLQLAGTKIVLEKSAQSCKLCGSTQELVEPEGICHSCVERIKAM